MTTATPRWIHSIQAAVSPSGGMSAPWHVGQSGQPMPLPVERTIAPITTSRYVAPAVTNARRSKSGERWAWVIRTREL